MSRVLIVDDEKNVLTTLTIGLRRHKYGVRQANSGPEALKIMEEDPCDVVVSDIRMSPMSGFTLASRIREKYPGVSIVLMSAYGVDEVEPELEDMAVFPRLTKPFSVSELIDIIRAEGKKGRRKNVLVIGDGNDGQRICDILKSIGYSSEIVKINRKMRERWRGASFDFFLIDEECLDGQEWKVLNEIDQFAPEKPVILLAKKKGRHESFTAPDVGGQNNSPFNHIL